MKILSAAQMAEVDRLTTDRFRIPSILLMESAGRAVADELERACPGLSGKRVLILCGKGNNGGDGFVVARYLHQRGGTPEVVLAGDPAALKGDAAANWQMVRALGIRTSVFADPGDAARWLRTADRPDVIVDALFGTGLSKPLRGGFSRLVAQVNELARNSFVVSVDIPSGLAADTGRIPGPHVRPELTVTFTALKPAQVLPPACEETGRVVLAQIGSPAELLNSPEHKLEGCEAAWVQRVLPVRARDGHKGTFGHLFVLAGSKGKSGAALMTGMAALRSGAGLVTLMLPAGLQRSIVGKFPELMAEALPQTPEGTIDESALDAVLGFLESADAVVVGPGLTTQASTRRLVVEVVHRSPVPVVLDADGINAFGTSRDQLRNMVGHPVVITPHPGEMARLVGQPIAEVQNNRLETARGVSLETGAIVVLKGYRTVTAMPDGRCIVNLTGNPGMATGGTGDILAGIMGRLVAGWNRSRPKGAAESLAESVAVAVHLHGLAGDLAATERGEESLVATDLLEKLPEAMRSVRQS